MHTGILTIMLSYLKEKVNKPGRQPSKLCWVALSLSKHDYPNLIIRALTALAGLAQ